MKAGSNKDLTIKRIFRAPRWLIWQYWTVPLHFKKWWGPKIFTCPVSKIDLKVGGIYHHCMKGADGKEYWSTGIYKKIVPLEKLIMTDSFSDKKGNIISAAEYGMKGFPLELEVTVTFEETAGKTKMILVHSGIENIDQHVRKDMKQGWEESFDKLTHLVEEIKL